MTVNYTTNLALGQPVTGTESGTWGDDVNNAVTSYLDIAIAGGLSVTVTTADVTLTITQGTSSATNIGSTTAQYAILNVSGAMTAARNLIVPSSSRIYLINNNTTGGFALTVKGAATSGVTLVNGEKAHVFWNGTDYAKLSNSSGAAGSFSSITDSGNLTFTGTGNRITGDFNNATIASRVAFQTSTANSSTAIPILPNGTSTNAQLQIYNNSDPTNGSFLQLASLASSVNIFSSIQGTGTYLPMTFTTGGSERMRLDTSGNLGVGTSSPSNTLQVANGITSQIRVSEQTLAFYYDFGRDSADGFFSINGNQGLGYKWKSAGTERMRIDSSGNLGIANSAPSNKLSVGDGTADTRAVFSPNSAFAIGVANGAGFAGWIGGSGTTDTMVFSNSGGTERMRITPTGDVGVGTSSPGGKIEASSSTQNIILSRSTGSYAAFQRLAPTGQQTYDFYTINSVEVARITGDASYLGFSTGSAANERMRIDSSGNVGIGATANASAILDAQSTTKGVRMPNMTTTQKNAISSPAAGLMVFDTTLAKLCVYSGSAWQTITSV